MSPIIHQESATRRVLFNRYKTDTTQVDVRQMQRETANHEWQHMPGPIPITAIVTFMAQIKREELLRGLTELTDEQILKVQSVSTMSEVA